MVMLPCRAPSLLRAHLATSCHRYFFLKMSLMPLCWLAMAIASPSQLRVLLTGFEPFDKQSANPSGVIAAALNGTCVPVPVRASHGSGSAAVCFESVVLPVSSMGASFVASRLSVANVSAWDAVLHLGEDVPAMFQSVTKLHLELVAANVRSHTATNTVRTPKAATRTKGNRRVTATATAGAATVAAVGSDPGCPNQ